MRILVIGWLHHKNKIGMELIAKHLGADLHYGSSADIRSFDVIYCPSGPEDVSAYPSKKFIFGPHFSVFPDKKYKRLRNPHHNAVYIQPSQWAVDFWVSQGGSGPVPNRVLPFPVETDRFTPAERGGDDVFVYYKSRCEKELSLICSELDRRDVRYKVFGYKKRYEEADYLKCLQRSKYGIVLDAHESQGFAIEEALSCNVPLLVWSAQRMNQEIGYNYPPIPCTTVPYWDGRCGEVFHDAHELESKFEEFLGKLEQYSPREYILEGLSAEACAGRFSELLDSI